MADPTTRWEYKTVRIKPGLLGSFDTEAIDAELCREGANGWELVNVLQTGTLQLLCALKRPC